MGLGIRGWVMALIEVKKGWVGWNGGRFLNGW